MPRSNQRWAAVEEQRTGKVYPDESSSPQKRSELGASGGAGATLSWMREASRRSEPKAELGAVTAASTRMPSMKRRERAAWRAAASAVGDAPPSPKVIRSAARSASPVPLAATSAVVTIGGAGADGVAPMMRNGSSS